MTPSSVQSTTASTVRRADSNPPPPQQAAEPPAEQEPKDSWLKTGAKVVLGGTVGTAGAAVGAVVGGFKNVGAQETELSKKAHKLTRYAGAVAIAAAAITAGVMTGGLAGVAIALVGGNPVVAGALAGAVPSGVEAGVDGIKGAVRGGKSGAQIGWKIATAPIDWIADKFGGGKAQEGEKPQA